MTYDKITFPARVILGLLPEGVPLTGAEVGVHRGHTAASLLFRRPRLTLYLVDHWGERGKVEGNHGPAIRNEAERTVALAVTESRLGVHGRARWLVGDSTRQAHHLPDKLLDFAHIDADHRYPKVLEDMRAWWPKVKPGGFLCGHDLDNHPPEFEPWDVRRAVEEFAAEQGLDFDVYQPEMEWVIRKP